jgi:hypothetical protein
MDDALNTPQVSDATWVYPEDPLKWELDENKFRISHPTLYSEFVNSASQSQDLDTQELIYDIFGDHNEDVFSISKVNPAICITLTDGATQVISNVDIAKVHGNDLDSATAHWRYQFICCCLGRAMGQAGSLAIWDTVKNDWCFFYTDEGFCVTEIDYNSADDTFSGSYEYHYPMTGVGGVEHFVVTSEREYQEIPSEPHPNEPM